MAIKMLQEWIEVPVKHIEIFNNLNITSVRGILLHGPSGIGKTLLINAFINETGINCFNLTGPQIVVETKHDTNYLQNIFKNAYENKPSIIVIESIDYISAIDKNDINKDLKEFILTTLISLIDNSQSHIFVIGVTNKNINNITPNIKSFGRFDKNIQLNLPNYNERIEILKVHTKYVKISIHDLETIANKTIGFTGGDLAQLCRDAVLLCINNKLKQSKSNNFNKYESKTMVIEYKYFDEVMDIRCDNITIPNIKLQDMSDNVQYAKTRLIERIQFPNIYNKYNFDFLSSVSKGCLLWGPPGCGKKSLAKAIAYHFGRHLVELNGLQLLNIGTQEMRIICNVFHEAKTKSPSILLIDKLDAVYQKDTIISQLLMEIDKIYSTEQVYVIASTNRPDMIDSSLTRVGYLDELLFIDLPDFPSRISILKSMTGKLPMDASVDFETISEYTHGFNAVALKCLLRSAMKLAMRNVMDRQIQKCRLFLVYGYVRRMERVMEMLIANDVYLLIRKYFETEEITEINKHEEASLITMDMLKRSLKCVRRPLSSGEYQKYLSLKLQFDKQYGTAQNDSNMDTNVLAPTLQIDDDDDDDGDIYD
eukprot:213544_1